VERRTWRFCIGTITEGETYMLMTTLILVVLRAFVATGLIYFVRDFFLKS
jgi:hypothetical protein